MTKFKRNRLEREKLTIEKMIAIFCRRHHQDGKCCACKRLKKYALERLSLCPFKEDKPVCATCNIHCYESEMQTEIKKVMRFVGPRLVLVHPILAFMHFVDVIFTRNQGIKKSSKASGARFSGRSSLKSEE